LEELPCSPVYNFLATVDPDFLRDPGSPVQVDFKAMPAFQILCQRLIHRSGDINPMVYGHGPEMLGFIPHFASVGGLYFATTRSVIGWVTVLVSTPIMTWQFSADQVRTVLIQGIPLSLTSNLTVLVALLSVMIALAFARLPKGRGFDRMLGNLTPSAPSVP
jgi:hypothetical protein